jgi:2-phosphosulfolactate phosphatase
MSEPGILNVHLLPSLVAPGVLRGRAAVVVDVLRATTTMVHALSAGCRAVLPCVTIEEAHSLAGALPVDSALICGEREGRAIPGFDLGNSPEEFSRSTCAGKTLVMTTTNGTAAIAACLDAAQVLVAGFVNLAATAAWLLRHRTDRGLDTVHIICAGTNQAVSYEDTLLAAALTHALASGTARPFEIGNDAARLCLDLSPREFEKLPERLRRGAGGRKLLALGLDRDIADAARVDAIPLVAGLDRRESPLRIIKLTD